MRALLNSFLQDQSGATAIEYGLIAALISVVIVASVTALGVGVRDTLFVRIGSALSS